jgi:YVTN family beta-propeller protein
MHALGFELAMTKQMKDGPQEPTAPETGETHVSVINATQKVVATIDVGLAPFAVAVAPDGSKVYATNLHGDQRCVRDDLRAFGEGPERGDERIAVAVATDPAADP